MKKDNKSLQSLLLALLAGAALLACQPSYTYVYNTADSSKEVDSPLLPDPKIEEMIKPYREELEAEMGEVIGYAGEPLPKSVEGSPESPLGKFCADLILEEGRERTENADLSLVNTGGLRVPIAEGPINVGLIFELMPFENEVVSVELKGSDLAELFKMISEEKVLPLANAVPSFRRGKFVGANIGGRVFHTDSTYYLVTTDYLAKGGDNMQFLVGKPVEYLGIKVRDAIIEHIRELNAEGKKAMTDPEPRVVFE